MRPSVVHVMGKFVLLQKDCSCDGGSNGHAYVVVDYVNHSKMSEILYETM